MSLLPLTIEVFNSLLRILERLASFGVIGDPARVRGIPARYCQWLLGQLGAITTPDRGEVWGWHSEHTHTARLLHVWETSQVLLFLLHYKAWLDDLLQRELLAVATFTVSRPEVEAYLPISKGSWTSDEPSGKEFYRAVWRGFIAPRRQPPDKDAQLWSMLLYGPPGTSKTSTARQLAALLGWRFIHLTPSDFIVRGGQLVEARAKAIFRALEALSETVILFDEIDRLLLDRDSTEYSKQEDVFQFMTPGMLAKLDSLRRRARSIFIITTNYEERIDPAIKRRGRIDSKLLVLPPMRGARRRHIRKVLDRTFKGKPLDAALLEEAVSQTALFTPREIAELIKESISNAVTVTGAISALAANAAKRKPDISLLAYDGRFNEARGWQQYATEEFQLLYRNSRTGRPQAQSVVDLAKRVDDLAKRMKEEPPAAW